MAAHVVTVLRRRSGPPRAPENKRRTYFAHTRFSPDEADPVIQAARERGMTICQFLREAALFAAENGEFSGSNGSSPGKSR